MRLLCEENGVKNTLLGVSKIKAINLKKLDLTTGRKAARRLIRGLLKEFAALLRKIFKRCMYE